MRWSAALKSRVFGGGVAIKNMENGEIIALAVEIEGIWRRCGNKKQGKWRNYCFSG